MTNTGKNFLAIKVFDDGCDACLHMSRYDHVVFNEFEDVHYDEVPLDVIVNHGNDLTKVRIYKTLEKEALNSDYTIDLPVYLVFSKKGEYKGSHTGVATIVELREFVKESLGDTA